MAAVDTDGEPALRSGSARPDLDAVSAGLPPAVAPVHSKPGHRIKMLKRQMYGRTNLDLLRKRVTETVYLSPTTDSRKIGKAVQRFLDKSIKAGSDDEASR